jgi:glyoxylate/hydroxypyruvate reductase
VPPEKENVIALVAQVNNIEDWKHSLQEALPGEKLWIYPDIPDPAAVNIAFVAKPPAGALATFPNLELICSLWAGVDKLLADPTLPPTPVLTRLIDPRLTSAMTETVLTHVLMAHRQIPAYLHQQKLTEWRQLRQPHAWERRVGILGLGVLGQAAAKALRQVGFPVAGWSRSKTPQIEGVTVYTGDAALTEILAQSDILVSLLPHTPQTEGLLNAARLAQLPTGAVVINVGRGAVIVEDDLRSALDSGHLEAAILDVFAVEPLPPTHPFWSHDRILVLPHVASETDPRSAAFVVAETIRRYRAGEELPERVDRAAGY